MLLTIRFNFHGVFDNIFGHVIWHMSHVGASRGLIMKTRKSVFRKNPIGDLFDFDSAFIADGN